MHAAPPGLNAVMIFQRYAHRVRIEAALIPALFVFAATLPLPQASLEPAAPDSIAQFPYRAPEAAPRFPAPPRRYTPPEGFSGYGWGTLRSAFTQLPTEAAAVRASWTQGKRTGDELFCTGRGRVRCTMDDYADVQMRNHYVGDGFHVLSEYLLESQGFRFPTSGVVLHPVVYQFCANWHGMRKKVPEDFEELNKFCGMRMLFETETRSQLRELPRDHVTRYDLVFSELLARYGKPEDFKFTGRVTVESAEAPAAAAPGKDRKFSTWRWCPAPRDGLQTRCDASVVLAIDVNLGRGVVLFSTPALWRYAHARESIGEDTVDLPPDPLYALLHGRPYKPKVAAH
jgi:hypothetical protein